MTALDQSSPLLNDLSLDHPHLAKALDQLQEAIASPDTRQTALVIGPTGVGKTHLSKRITYQLNQLYLAEAKRDPQFLPVVQVTVPMVTDRGFSWRGYYDTCLHAVGCPFPAFKTVSEARDKLVATLKLRRVKVVFLDELQHLLHVGTAASLLRQSETLKSLAEASGVKHIGYGTYDLLNMVRSNGQLSRRTEIIHFRRYNQGTEDYAAFVGLLRVLENQISTSLALSLTENSNYIYEGCVGLVGVLRDWLVRAATNSLRANEPAITREALEETELSVLDRMVILEEARSGEADLTPTETHVASYREMLGAPTAKKPDVAETHHQRRPFQKKPRR